MKKMDGHLNFQVDKNNGKWGFKVLYKIQVYSMGTDDNKYIQNPTKLLTSFY